VAGLNELSGSLSLLCIRHVLVIFQTAPDAQTTLICCACSFPQSSRRLHARPPTVIWKLSDTRAEKFSALFPAHQSSLIHQWAEAEETGIWVKELKQWFDGFSYWNVRLQWRDKSLISTYLKTQVQLLTS